MGCYFDDIVQIAAIDGVDFNVAFLHQMVYYFFLLASDRPKPFQERARSKHLFIIYRLNQTLSFVCHVIFFHWDVAPPRYSYSYSYYCYVNSYVHVSVAFIGLHYVGQQISYDFSTNCLDFANGNTGANQRLTSTTRHFEHDWFSFRNCAIVLCSSVWCSFHPYKLQYYLDSNDGESIAFIGCPNGSQTILFNLSLLCCRW